ncbi:MAG: HD domain-containing protein [Kosmotoga sp.]|jgi:putative hydrolase of HD superfamily|nr:MAG: HD domain-containing protein [Kosmotoga sp.]
MEQGVMKLMELATNLFTMFRWNNTPTMFRTNEAENAFASAQFALLMSYLARESSMSINEKELLERIVLKELPKCVLSDISVDTKLLIRDLDPEKWNAVYNSAVGEVVDYLPETKKLQFSSIIHRAKDDSLEGKIISASDLLSARLEADLHNRIFPEYYGEIIKSLDDRLSQYNDFKPYKKLINSSWFDTYKESIIVLLRAVRWNRLNRNVKTTVAGHSFYVALIGFLLSYEEESNQLDEVEIIKRSLLHDIPESLTGDIITPTKQKVTGFEELVERVEEVMVSNKLLNDMPEKLISELKNKILKPFEGINGKLVRAADLTAAIVECLMEIKSGNNQMSFRIALNNMLDQLDESEFSSVKEVADFFKLSFEWTGR